MVMDYIDFIDSKDIRDFNRETLFSPAELSILVITSMHTSVDMKINALNNLIDVHGTELVMFQECQMEDAMLLMMKSGFTVRLESMWIILKKLLLKREGLGLKSHCILRV